MGLGFYIYRKEIMYSYGSYEIARTIDGPYDGKYLAVEPKSEKIPVLKVDPTVFKEPDPKTISKRIVGYYQNTKIKDTEGRFVFLWQGWED